MNQILPAVIFVLLLSATQIPLLAQEYTRDALKGLTGVNVGVLVDEEIQKQHSDLGRDIQRDVEVKARVAGLEILSSTDTMARPHFQISVIRASGPGFFVLFSLSEPAFLERDRTRRVQAVTWLRMAIVYVLDENEIRRYIKDWTEEFLSDWIITNPRQRQ